MRRFIMILVIVVMSVMAINNAEAAPITQQWAEQCLNTTFTTDPQCRNFKKSVAERNKTIRQHNETYNKTFVNPFGGVIENESNKIRRSINRRYGYGVHF